MDHPTFGCDFLCIPLDDDTIHYKRRSICCGKLWSLFEVNDTNVRVIQDEHYVTVNVNLTYYHYESNRFAN